MKKLLLSGTLVCAVYSFAGAGERQAVKFDYDVAFQTVFDNREYDRSDGLDISRTLFGVRAQAGLGIRIGSDSSKVKQRLLAGADPLYEFGGGWTVEPLLWYEISVPLRKCRFQLVAGAFPRSKSTEYYSDAFYSERNRFLKDTYDGLQFSWKGRNFGYEFGVDWMGMLSPAFPGTREQFVVYSAGHHTFLPGLKLGYSAHLHHYANSMKARNVVDDILVNPYIEYNAAHYAHVQTLLARVGYLQAFQRDRNVSGDLLSPAKGELYLEVRNWNVGIINDLYVGGDLLTLFDAVSPEGTPYGTDLYMREPFLRNRGGKACGIYDKVSVYYEPFIVRRLTFRLQLDFQFNGGFAGSRQMICVKYNL